MKHLAAMACILSLFCVLPAQASAPLNGGMPPMAENETCYVRLERWGQGNTGTTYFEYQVRLKNETEDLLQTIKVERSHDQLHTEDWTTIRDEPQTYISFQDLNADGKDDLKVLSANQNGKNTYIAYLWDEGQARFVEAPYPSWLARNRTLVLCAAGGILLLGCEAVFYRKAKKSK